jgi:hypothetical protein
MMKYIGRLLLVFILVFQLMACSPRTATPAVTDLSAARLHARQTLLDFLNTLHSGQFDQAALLYGGSYEIMNDHNPLVDPQDHASLLRDACTVNGAVCLQVFSIELVPTDYDRVFVFKVQFQQDDGSLFVMGPCCGANETDSPPQSSFLLRLSNESGDRMLVLDMPPYLP